MNKHTIEVEDGTRVDGLRVVEMNAAGSSSPYRRGSPGYFGSRLLSVFWYNPLGKLFLFLLIVGLAAAAGLWFYNRTHLFDSYQIQSEVDLEDEEGTRYVLLNNHIIKYGRDGVFCVDTANEASWIVAYSMQTPISDISDDMMVIAEQQGKQVYIINENGQVGRFETEYPIIQVKVSDKGVAAVAMNDGEGIRISLYSPAGSVLAVIRSTISESGYPLAFALSSNARQMAVSFLQADRQGLYSKIVFYDFSSPDLDEDSHIKESFTYQNLVIPELFFADSKTVVAVGDSAFYIFNNEAAVTQKAGVFLEREIVSCFHDSENLGFVFNSVRSDTRYDVEVYNYSGKRMIETNFDYEYSEVRMENDEILVYDAEKISVYRASGRQKLAVTYHKPIKYLASMSGYRKYLIITEEKMEQIYIE